VQQRMRESYRKGVGNRLALSLAEAVARLPWTSPLRRWLAVAAGIVVIVAAILAYLWTRPLPVPKVSNYVQLTHDGQPKQLVGTDGSRLYLGLGGTTLWGVAQVSVLLISYVGSVSEYATQHPSEGGKAEKPDLPTLACSRLHLDLVWVHDGGAMGQDLAMGRRHEAFSSEESGVGSRQ
jgi:hypothetical protein